MSKKLLPYHLFLYNGENYLINIEKMQAYSIDHNTYLLLKELSDGMETELTPELLEKLQPLELITENTENDMTSVPQKHVPLTSIELLVTQACNLRCVYCYEDKTGARMDIKTALQAVDWLIQKSEDMRSINIVFFGGEPLLNFPLIRAVVDYAEEEAQKVGKRVGFSITTNGTLLDEDINLFFQRHQFRIMISFDGTKKLQDAQRPYASGVGSYDLTLPKIKKLLELIPQTRGHAVILGDTSPEEVKNALQEIGFRSVTVAMNSLSLYTDAPENSSSSRDTRGMLTALEEEAGLWYSLIKAKNKFTLKGLIESSYLYGALLCLHKHIRNGYFCGAGRKMAAVTPSGDIYLCHRFIGLEEYKLGSIFSSRLGLEKYSQSPVETNDLCRQCFARYHCGGGCKHDHVSYSGSIDKPEERMCLVKQRELELAATVISHLTPEEENWLVREDIFPPKPCPLDF